MHGVHKYKVMSLASVDVRIASDVAKPEVNAVILKETVSLEGLSRRCWRR